MKTIIVTAAVVALTMASAQAQDAAGGTGAMGGMGGAGGRHHGQQQKNAKVTPPPRADEKAYKSAVKGIPDKPYDAWHGVR